MTTATKVIPNPGIHLSSYTVYDRPGSINRAVHLCDDCAAKRHANGTMAAKWSGECINGYCDDCQAGPSVSHFQLADPKPTPTDAKQITYNRTTRDYDATFDGQCIGSFPNHDAAEVALNDHAMRLIEDGLVDQPLALMAAVPDGTDDDDFSDCPAGPGEPERAPLPNGWMRMPEGDILDADGMRVHLDPDQGEPDPWPERAPTACVNWNSAPAARLIPVADLHTLAQTDPATFRAKLAALSSADLRTQATLYAIYASMLCDREISAAETLEHFRLSIDVHLAERRSEDRVCEVIHELALTDAPAMIEFLRSHTDAQRAQLAARFAAWLDRECEIHREPSHILKGWQALCVGAAASGLQIELADCLGYAAGWDSAVMLAANATVESYAAL